MRLRTLFLSLVCLLSVSIVRADNNEVDRLNLPIRWTATMAFASIKRINKRFTSTILGFG